MGLYTQMSGPSSQPNATGVYDGQVLHTARGDVRASIDNSTGEVMYNAASPWKSFADIGNTQAAIQLAKGGNFIQVPDAAPAAAPAPAPVAPAPLPPPNAVANVQSNAPTHTGNATDIASADPNAQRRRGTRGLASVLGINL